MPISAQQQQQFDKLFGEMGSVSTQILRSNDFTANARMEFLRVAYECESPYLFNHFLDHIYSSNQNLEMVRHLKLINNLCLNNPACFRIEDEFEKYDVVRKPLNHLFGGDWDDEYRYSEAACLALLNEFKPLICAAVARLIVALSWNMDPSIEFVMPTRSDMSWRRQLSIPDIYIPAPSPLEFIPPQRSQSGILPISNPNFTASPTSVSTPVFPPPPGPPVFRISQLNELSSSTMSFPPPQRTRSQPNNADTAVGAIVNEYNTQVAANPNSYFYAGQLPFSSLNESNTRNIITTSIGVSSSARSTPRG